MHSIALETYYEKSVRVTGRCAKRRAMVFSKVKRSECADKPLRTGSISDMLSHVFLAYWLRKTDRNMLGLRTSVSVNVRKILSPRVPPACKSDLCTSQVYPYLLSYCSSLCRPLCHYVHYHSHASLAAPFASPFFPGWSAHDSHDR